MRLPWQLSTDRWQGRRLLGRSQGPSILSGADQSTSDGLFQKHRRDLFPDQVTTLASGLVPRAQCKLPTRLAFRPRSLSLTCVMFCNTSEHLLVPRHFVGLGDSSRKRRHSFCPGGFTISLRCLRVRIKVETKQSRRAARQFALSLYIIQFITEGMKNGI